eukprot:6403885-Prymnesium_polylepis.1
MVTAGAARRERRQPSRCVASTRGSIKTPLLQAPGGLYGRLLGLFTWLLDFLQASYLSIQDMGRRTTGLQEGDARLQSGDVDEPLQDAKDDIERASLTSADEPRGRLPPLLLVLALGVLSTPM